MVDFNSPQNLSVKAPKIHSVLNKLQKVFVFLLVSKVQNVLFLCPAHPGLFDSFLFQTNVSSKVPKVLEF